MRRKWWPLFLTLLLQMVANPCMSSQPEGGRAWILMVINSLVVLALIYRLSFRIYHLIIACLLGIPILFSYWFTTSPTTDTIFLIITGVLYLYALFICTPLLLRLKQVKIDELFGALALYMLIGLTWAILYTEVEFFVPGSFSKSPGIAEFIYFSFTTLTTLGYGDILPLSCEARSLTSLEAMFGVFTLGVVVARLIAIHTTKKEA